MAARIQSAADTVCGGDSADKRVAAALIESAFRDLAGKDPVLRMRAALWVDGAKSRVDFETVCQALNVDSDYVRRLIHKRIVHWPTLWQETKQLALVVPLACPILGQDSRSVLDERSVASG